MKKRELERFIREYYGTRPSITLSSSGWCAVNFGYFEEPKNYRSFEIHIFADGAWSMWTHCNNERWRPVKADYEYWYLFIRPGDTSGLQLARKLCSLMGSKFENYQEPPF